MTTPGSALARTKPHHVPAGAAAQDLDFAEMLARARILAKSGLVPKALQENPEGIVLVGMRGAELGFSFGYSLENLDVIEGKAVPNAQARLTLLRLHGHEARFTESSSERATIRVRRKEYRDDPDAWVTFTYTIEDARRAELAVIWVEEWRTPPGGDRKKGMKYVIGDDRGLDPAKVEAAPAWAKKLIDAGPDAYRSKDNWRKDPASMLRAACVRHVTKMEFSDVMAGLGVDLVAAAWDFDNDVDEVVDVTPEPTAPDGPEEELDELTPIEDEAACPVPGCNVAGAHDHDRWAEQTATTASSDGEKGEPPPPAEPAGDGGDPMAWDGDKWREVLAATGLKQVTALKEARRLAEGQGAPLPNSIDELKGTPLAAQLAARLRDLS